MSTDQQWKKGGRYTTFRKWLNGFKVETGETHFNMLGAKYNIPTNKHDELYNQLTHAYNKYEIEGLIEKRPEIHRLFFDIDIENNLPISQNEHKKIYEYIRTIQSVICELIGGNGENKPQMIIARSPLLVKNDKEKIGIHLIWPEIYVKTHTEQITNNIRAKIISKLASVYGERDPNTQNSWTNVVDDSVLKPNGNGLRMLYTCKRRNDSVRPYEVDEVWTGMDKDETLTNKLKEDKHAALIRCSLYCNDNINICNIDCPPPSPSPPLSSKTAKTTTKTTAKTIAIESDESWVDIVNWNTEACEHYEIINYVKNLSTLCEIFTSQTSIQKVKTNYKLLQLITTSNFCFKQ